MDIDEMLLKLNDPKLKKAISDLKNSPKGKEVVKKLEATDKNKLMGYIKNINDNNISSKMLLNQLEKNPNVLDKLSGLLNKM